MHWRLFLSTLGHEKRRRWGSSSGPMHHWTWTPAWTPSWFVRAHWPRPINLAPSVLSLNVNQWHQFTGSWFICPSPWNPLLPPLSLPLSLINVYTSFRSFFLPHYPFRVLHFFMFTMHKPALKDLPMYRVRYVLWELVRFSYGGASSRLSGTVRTGEGSEEMGSSSRARRFHKSPISRRAMPHKAERILGGEQCSQGLRRWGRCRGGRR